MAAVSYQDGEVRLYRFPCQTNKGDSVPYHPETNSIEEFFSQLKHYIKKESPNTYEDIDITIKDILENTPLKI